MKAKNKFGFVFLLFIAESIFLIYYSVIPATGTPFERPVFLFQDIIIHFFAYLVYGILAERVINLGGFKGIKNSILTALIIGSVFGAFTEILQAFTPTRIASLTDWVVDILGSGIGGYLSAKKLRK